MARAPVSKFYLGHPERYQLVPQRTGLPSTFGGFVVLHPFPSPSVLPSSVAIRVAPCSLIVHG
jgi:hypothetical protein